MTRKFLFIPLLLLLVVWLGQRPFPPPTIAAQSPSQLDQQLFPAAVTFHTVTSLNCESQPNSNLYLPLIIKSRASSQQAAPQLTGPQITNAPNTVDRSVAYDIYDATRFLYTGSNPAQTGLGANTIDRRCITVLRGNIIKTNGQPLPGVAITLPDYPEFGQTLSDSKGLFNFVLNGGAPVVVAFNKTGYLTVQRHVDTTRRQYETVAPVVLIQPDSKTTAIDPGSTAVFQVAQGSVVTDNDGTRQATLLFPATAFATMRAQAQNQQLALAPLTFRATEYTAGSTGGAAMPGELPPTSGYTYAVDFSFDETAGQSVVFDQPVINYTENLIGAPVGSAVPAGYYDESLGQWLPANNGIVIKIVSISGGAANLDVTGDGVADTGTALSNLGITTAERQQLATLYNAGEELWRVLIPHFSPWDFNWPFGPPDDAKKPPMPPPNTDQPNPCNESGSIINCDTQALGESLPIVGTPFTLNYTSRRVPGWKADNRLDVPIVVGALPSSLKSVYMEAEVGGQMTAKWWIPNGTGQPFGIPGYYTGTIDALTSNLSYPLEWNGQDGYGRLTNGRLLANVTVRYVYGYQYYATRDEFQQSFGQFGDNVFLSNGREYCKYMNYPRIVYMVFPYCGIDIVTSYSRPLGVWDSAAAIGLGGWSLDVHHTYDPNDGVLHMGDGRDLSSSDIGLVVSAAIPDISQINYMGDFAVAPDGTIYFVDHFERHIMRLNADGSLTVVAGNGSQGMPTGDGGPATDATLGYEITALAIAPDGSLYIGATFDNYNVGLIRHVDANGIISTIAGNFTEQYNLPNGDGSPAADAYLNKPEDILFGPDGGLYIAESPLYRKAGGDFSRIRKITPDGFIHTIAGAGGNPDPGADLAGLPALAWGALPVPGRMAFTADGSLLIPHPAANTVSRIGPDGMLRRMAGNGGTSNLGDGGLALDANVGNPQSVVVDANDTIYIRTRFSGYDRVRRVLPDGLISTFAGRGDCIRLQNNDGYSALRSCFSSFGSNNSLEIAPDGSMLINSTRSTIERIHTIQSVNASAAASFYVPNPDGTEVYEFSAAGRHLRTLQALTGAALYTFGYNNNGHLTSITDFDGNTTTIERNGNDQPTAIVAAGGQRTPLTLTSSGYLHTVANPAGNTVTLTYNPAGLLTSLTDPRVGISRFLYDGNGRLTRDTNAANKVINLSRLEQPNLTSVTLSTGMGETTTYTTEMLANGDRQRSVTLPNGATQKLLIGEGSVFTLTSPDGSVERVTYEPDPRWGMNAPLAASMVITTPGNLQLATTVERTVELATANDPFSVKMVYETVYGNGQTWNYKYSAANGTFTMKTPEGRYHTFTLDAAGRLLTANHDSSGALTPTNLTYDSLGRLKTINQLDRTTTFGYNSANWLTSQTAPDGRFATFAYDATGRMTTAVLPGNRTLAFTYDAAGNQTSLTPPGRPAHTFTYAADDQPLTYTPPTVSGGGSSQWAYNADRNLTTYTRPGGSSIGLAYLNNGSPLGSITLARGTRILTYDAAGRIQALTDPSGIGLSYTYDGPLVTQHSQVGAVAGTVQFAYNTNWLIGSMTVNNTDPVAYQYDNDQQLTSAGSLTINHHPDHGLVTGSQLDNVSDAWTYNAYAEVASYAATANTTSLYQTTFTRDINGRIVTKVETIGGSTNTDGYTYDLAGRLTGVSRNGSPIGIFTYDANANRLSANGTNATYDAQDRLVQAGTAQFTYTAAGERATKTVGSAVTSYQHDEAGNLLAVTLPNSQQITYLVDALNRRVGKRINGTLVQGFLYQGDYQPVAELDGSNAVISRFVYGSRANVPEYLIKGGQTYRIIADHLGSPRLVVNTLTGEIVQRLDYDVWGNVTQDSNPGFQPFGFAGGLYDRDTGLVRFGLRDYDAVTGQWLSKDPVGFAGNSTNLYAYVGSDPVNYIDPSGTEDESAPSPCNPNKTWDEKLRENGFDVLKKVPNWLLPKSLQHLKDGYKKLEQTEKLRDDIQSIKENLDSSDPRDTAEALEDALDYVPQVVPLTPMEVVKETIRRGIEAVQRGIDGREGVRDSPNPILRDRWYATHADQF